MRTISIKFFSIILIITLYLLLGNLFLIPLFPKNFYILIKPIFWIILGISCYIIGGGYTRFKNKFNKMQKIIIILLIYFFIYYFSGLIFGFDNSPYSHNIISVLKNMWQFVIFIIFQEYARGFLVNNSNKSKIKLIIITILFIIGNINFKILFSNFTTPELAFKYISSTILPLIFSNITCTYLTFVGSFKLTLLYRLPIELMYIILPTFPSLNWFLEGFIGITLPIVVYMFISFDHVKSVEKVSKRNLKKENPFLMIPFLIFVTICVCFVVGLFKYEPMAIVSNSMSPTYDRGAVIIFEKLDKKQLENLELYTIIVYRLDNIYVSHRIVKIQKVDGKVVYTTKGDNNVSEDNKKVNVEQITGVVRANFPFVGYPSVWLNDIFSNSKVEIETGK